ncbi:myosin XVA, partial [Chelydra serpentina]
RKARGRADLEGVDRHTWRHVGRRGCLTQMHSICNLPPRSPREEPKEDGVEDMTQLQDLQEVAVLHNIKTRFDRELIYTYIGSILVSVNPYKMYNIYGTE